MLLLLVLIAPFAFAFVILFSSSLYSAGDIQFLFSSHFWGPVFLIGFSIMIFQGQEFFDAVLGIAESCENVREWRHERLISRGKAENVSGSLSFVEPRKDGALSFVPAPGALSVSDSCGALSEAPILPKRKN